MPADHACQRCIPEGQVTQVGNVEVETGMVTPGHADHPG